MKTIRLLILALFISFGSYAQYYQTEEKQNYREQDLNKKSFKDRISFGGNLGVEFGSNGGLILVAPVALYEVTNNFKAGVGVNYIYMRDEFWGKKYNTSVYGFRLLGIFYPFKNLILNTEFEHNYIDRNYSYAGEVIKPYWQSAWFVGGGYAVPMGRGSFVISMSYDVLYSPGKSYYSSPWRPTIGFYF